MCKWKQYFYFSIICQVFYELLKVLIALQPCGKSESPNNQQTTCLQWKTFLFHQRVPCEQLYLKKYLLLNNSSKKNSVLKEWHFTVSNHQEKEGRKLLSIIIIVRFYKKYQFQIQSSLQINIIRMMTNDFPSRYPPLCPPLPAIHIDSDRIII